MDGIGQSLLFMQAGSTGREWLVFTVMAVVFIAPFVLGNLIARAMRLEDLSTRIGVVLFSIFASLAPFIVAAMQTRTVDVNGEKTVVYGSWKDAIHLGIDLEGGANLVYAINNEVAEQQQKKEKNRPIPVETIDKMVAAIAKRINPSGAEEMTVRRVGTDRIEVIIPGADPELVEQKKRMITRLGSLEFGIVANMKDHAGLIEKAKQLSNTVSEVRGADNRVLASWRDIDEKKFGDDPQHPTRDVQRTDPRTGESVTVHQYLIVHDKPERTVTGSYLRNASPTMDSNGNPAVSFRFNERGAALFGQLTQDNLPDTGTDKFHRKLAILLDGKVRSAPVINSRINDSGIIEGRFDMKEVNDLVGVLNAGALEVPLIETPISEFTISPLLGVDVQEKGIRAIIASAAVVFIFMLVYYALAGLIADLSLVLNLLLVVGCMAFISATFTLPGLAGLVLTIGMAVDSNVLIYERMREEFARGASFRMAIQNGFDKAFAAIFDGNVTSLITAVILYLIGTDLIRGFAVSLFIGLSVSMFSVLYFGHLAFDILERKRVVKSLKMLQFIGQTNLDFLKTRGIAFLCSGAIIVAGMGALFARGDSNWDIDMSGGTMATFEFVDKQNLDEIRDQLEKEFPNGVSLERLTLQGETKEAGKRYRIRVSQSREEVIAGINKAFADPKFAVVRVTVKDFKVTPTGPLEGDLARFSNGQQAAVELSDGMTAETLNAYIAQTLEAIPGTEANSKKYSSVQNLLHVTGKKQVAGDMPLAAEIKFKTPPKFTELTAMVAPEISEEDFTSSLQKIQERLKTEPVLDEVNSFDTSVASETKWSAFEAVMASLVMIVIYIWFRFEKIYFGLAAVTALAHDVLITLGAIALGAYVSKTPLGPPLMLEDFKINMNQIACLLTIVGYSLNDTIVIFDRIREIKGKNPNITYDMINLSVNQTLSRTLLTALTTFLVTVVLYIAGGEGIHGFAFSMIVGVITGCYSTVYIANPVLLWLVTREAQMKQANAKAIKK